MLPKRSPTQKRHRTRLLIGASFIIGAIGAVWMAVDRDSVDVLVGTVFVVLAFLLGLVSISDRWKSKDQ